MPLEITVKRIGKPLQKVAERTYEVFYDKNRRWAAEQLWECIIEECPKPPKNKWATGDLVNWLRANKSRCIKFTKEKGMRRIVRINIEEAPNIIFIVSRCKPHIIRPRFKRYLHFFKEGKEFFIRHGVHHPGKSANNFLYRAARRYSARYLAKIA